MRNISFVVVCAATLACAGAAASRQAVGVDAVSGSVQFDSVRQGNLVCTNLAGQITPPGINVKCMPCVPEQNTMRARLEHSRALLAHVGPRPFSNFYTYVGCIKHGYEMALDSLPNDPFVRMEYYSWQLSAVIALERGNAIRQADGLIHTAVTSRDSALASMLLGQFGLAVWDRASRMLARPVGKFQLAVDDSVHDLRRAVRDLQQLPPIPTASKELGQSESDWARAIFEKSASLAHNEAQRSQQLRLALATYLAREQWRELDSAAKQVLVTYPHDSVAPLARALAQFRMVSDPVREYPRVMALFDSALHTLPVGDSLAFERFDDVLSALDDSWRLGLPDEERQSIDQRAWKVFDPLWLTDVNELQLVRRARMADANIRFAAVALPGQSGSATDAGTVLLKRSFPEPRWRVPPPPPMPIGMTAGNRFANPVVTLERTWLGGLTDRHRFASSEPGSSSTIDIPAALWSNEFTLHQRIHVPIPGSERCRRAVAEPTLYKCVKSDNGYWEDVPFEVRRTPPRSYRDTIDVTMARFRTGTDSVDLFVAGRVPLRTFWHRNDTAARRQDSIVYGVTIATSLGDHLFQSQRTRALPSFGEVSFVEQWTVRAPIVNMMHRVEAYVPRQLRAARGSRRLTSPAEATFVTTGFGLSDILLADSLAISGNVLSSWRDLRVMPNAGVVAPGGRLAMAWEIYGLTPDSLGRVQWRVSLSREDGLPVIADDARDVIVGSAHAGAQIHAVEPDASLISFRRETAASDVVVDFLFFHLSDTRPGRHVIIVRIDDLVAGTSTTRSASIRILDERAQGRPTSTR